MRNKNNRTVDTHTGTFTRCLAKGNTQYLVSDRESNSLTLVSGTLLSYRIPNGYSLYGGTTHELVDFYAVSTAQKSLNITILLQGKLDFGYDDLMFHLDAESDNRAVVVNLARPVTFCRIIHENNKVVKLNISLPLHWIESRVDSMEPLSAFIKHHLEHASIILSKNIIKLSHEIINLGTPKTFMNKIQIEVLSKSLLYEIFKQLNRDNLVEIKSSRKHIFTGKNNRADPFAKTLDELLIYIEANIEKQFSVQQLAQFTAMSLSNLQRKFKQSLGVSIQSYIRRRRLELAKQQLEKGVFSITEAAYNAGYRHPSNFTNAFKKTFGFAPREMINQS